MSIYKNICEQAARDAGQLLLEMQNSIDPVSDYYRVWSLGESIVQRRNSDRN